MNPLGIFFGIGARDDGADAAMAKAAKGVRHVNKAVQDQNKEAGKGILAKAMAAAETRALRLTSAIFEGVKGFNIASIAGSMRDLTGETGNLTNGLEGMAVAASAAVRPMIAGMNLTGKAARRLEGRIVGMSTALNLDASSVAETLKGYAQATGPVRAAIDALGLSERDLVKVTEVTGVKFGDLTDMAGNMMWSWGATPQAAAGMINALVEVGRKANVGFEPLKTMNNLVGELTQAYEGLPSTMQPSADAIQAMTVGVVKMAGVYRRLGKDESEAMTLGQATGKMFADQAVAIRRAQMGLGDWEDSPLFKALTMYGVGAPEAQRIIELGAQDAVAGVQALQATYQRLGITTASQQAMQAELSKTLGESAAGLAYLAQDTRLSTDALAEMGAVTATSATALKDLNKAFSDKRTLQERLDFAKEIMETRFRKISKPQVNAYIKDLTGQMGAVGKEVQRMQTDPVLGPLLRKASLAGQIGPAAFFMDERDPASRGRVAKSSAWMQMLSTTAEGLQKAMGPVMETAGSLGAAVQPIMAALGPLGPLAAAGGGLMAWFALPEDLRGKIVDQVKPLFEDLKRRAGEIWFGTEGKEGLGKQIWKTFTGAWDGLTKYVDEHWMDVVDGIQTGVTFFVEKMLPPIVKVAGQIIGTVVEKSPYIVAAMGAIVGQLATAIIDNGPKLLSAFVEAAGPLPTALIGLFAAGKLVGIGGGIAEAMSGVFAKGGAVATTIIGSFGPAGAIGLGIAAAIGLVFAGLKIKQWIDEGAKREEAAPTQNMMKSYRRTIEGRGIGALLRASSGQGSAKDLEDVRKLSMSTAAANVADPGRYGSADAQRSFLELVNSAAAAPFGPTAWATMDMGSRDTAKKQLMASLKGAQQVPAFAAMIEEVIGSKDALDIKAGRLAAIAQIYDENRGKVSAMLGATAEAVGASGAKNLLAAGFTGVGIAKGGGFYGGGRSDAAAAGKSTFVPATKPTGATAADAAVAAQQAKVDKADAAARKGYAEKGNSVALLRQIAGYTQRTAVVLEKNMNAGRPALVLGT